MTASENLVWHVKASGLTQKEIASSAGISCPYLNDLLNNRRRPSADVAERLMDALTVPAYAIAEFVGLYVEELTADWRSLIEETKRLT